MLNEQCVTDFADPSGPTVRAGRHRFGQAVWAEDLAAVSAVVLPLLPEAVLAAVALVHVVLVLPSDLQEFVVEPNVILGKASIESLSHM